MSGNVNQRPNILNLSDRTSAPTKKVIRAPMPKKRSKGVPLSERVTLERVLGLTVRDNRTFACDPTTGLVVYPAGCVIVLFNPRRNKQFHIFNQSRKTITALAISGDGKNVVSGECGHKPAVRVWDVEEKTQLAEFHGHKFGINCVAFSPNLKYVVSVGEQHDMVVNVWNWKDGSKHAAGKISVKVSGMSFSEDGSRFVTAGNRSIRFWYMSSKSKTRETYPLNSRSGILGEQRNNFFCSVACGRGINQAKTYAVTKSGLLCEFSEQRLLDKWVELRTTSAYCIIASEEYLFVGCADGIVRLFNASSLHFVATLPKPHSLGVNVSDGIDPSHMITHREHARYPAVIAITHDDVSKKTSCVYSDHSMYVWDVHDVRKIGKQRSFLYHSSCIWGVEVYPTLTDKTKEALPPGSFLTFSADDTIRMWNVDPAMSSDTLKRNIYSNELLKVIYVDDELENLCSVDSNPASDKIDNVEGKNGIRCISISNDGQFLASGDRSGNIRVHDMQFMDEVQKIEAHDSEVLCLEFSSPESGYHLLASASRDRLIHVFNMQEDCSLLQTLDDHSSSITAVKFTQSNGRLQMISCGADKALMFRVVTQNPDFELIRNHHVVGKTTMYDLTIDPTEKYVATACQDRNIRIHNAVTGKLKRTYKGSLGEDGTLIRVELDPSGMYIATSCSDKSVAIFDFYSGECVATMAGHSELVTGIKFTNDCKYLISTSGDGCIFVWRLPWGFTHNMKERLNEMGQHMKEAPAYPHLRRGTYVVPPEMDPQVVNVESRKSSSIVVNAVMSAGGNNVPIDAEITEEQEEEEDEEEEDQVDWQARPQLGSTTELPLWAKKQVCGEDLPSPTTYSNPAQPRGRWAQRLDSKGFKVKSEWDAHRDIELRLEDAIDRRRYTVEPDNLAEQATMAEAGRLQSSLCVTEADEFVPAEEGLADLEEQVGVLNPLIEGFVTSSRGSDPFLPPTSHPSDAFSPDTPDDEQSLAKLDDQGEVEEEEANEVIIYPPSEESSSSPESLKFQVTESTSSLEELQRRRARSIIKKESPRSSRVLEGIDLAKAVDGSENTDPVSLGTSEDEDEEDEDCVDEAEVQDNDEAVDKEKTDTVDDPSSSTVPTSTGSSPRERTDGKDAASPDQDEADDEESFLHTNYTFTEKEKFGKCLEQLQSGFASVGLNGGNHHRLSISSKFLSRSQLSHIRGVAASASNMPSSSVGGVTAQVYLQRRKDVMAKAVDETRRRLQSMGWNSFSLSNKSTSISSSSTSSTSSTTTVTTPISTPTSPKKPLETVATSSTCEDDSGLEAPPETEQIKGSEKRSGKDDTTSVASRQEGMDAVLDEGKNDEKVEKVVDSLKNESDSIAESAASSKQLEKQAVDFRQIYEEDKKVGDRVKSKESKEIKELEVVSENFHLNNQPEVDMSKVNSEIQSLDEGDNLTESESHPNIPDKMSNAQTISQPDSIVSLQDQSKTVTPTPDHAHIPIIKSKRPVSAPVEMTEDAVEKANKENLDRSSKYDPHQGRRSISSSSKSKMEKMKARKEQASTTMMSSMRKTTSMSDLTEAAKFDGESRSESPSFSMVLRSHPRSHSVERKRIRANSPAREKHRARSDRVLPLVPGVSRPKSYEIGTTSSLAKVSARKDSETPPSSPSRATRGKRPSFGASSEGSRPSKSGGSSPEVFPETPKNLTSEEQSAKDALAEKEKQLIESAVDSQERASKDLKDARRSSSPSRLSSETSHKDQEVETDKNQADKLAMPPPTSTTVAKNNRSLRRSSAARVELRQQRRRGLSAKTPTPSNNTSSTEDLKGSSDSVSTPENSQIDVRPVSPRSRSSSYRENRSSSLRESLSPKTSRKAPAPTVAVEAKEEIQGDQSRAPLKLQNSNDDTKGERITDKPSPRRRRRERKEDEANISNNNNTMTPQSEDSQHNKVDKSHSPKSRSQRRRSSGMSDMAERSSPTTSHLGDGKEEEKKTDEKEAPLIRVPSQELETSVLTFDMMKARVDSMKTAFDQCLELCVKAQASDVPGEMHQHFLDYFTSTFSRMQAASSTFLSSRHNRRLLNPSVTDDTLSDVSESSLPFDDLMRSSSSGIAISARQSGVSPSDVDALRASLTRQSGVSPSDVDALRASLTSCRKTPPNGMTSDVETTSAVALLDHYSKMLVSLVQHKIRDEVSEGSAATKTQHSLDSAL